MTVAPESPPVPATGAGDAEPGPVLRRRGGRPAPAARPVPVAVDRTPAGVVALVEPVPVRRAAGRSGGGRRSGPAGPARPPADRERVRAARPVTAGQVEAAHPGAPAGRRAGVGDADEPEGRVLVDRRAASGRPAPVRPGAAGAVRTVVTERVADRAGGPSVRPAGCTDGPGPVLLPPTPARRRPTGARVIRPARPGLRVTRRGQLLGAVLALTIGVMTLLGVAGRIGALDESAPLPASAPSQVVVAPGDTLWSIAERVAPQRDPRTVVAQIRRLNGMPSVDVRAGQTLLLRAP